MKAHQLRLVVVASSTAGPVALRKLLGALSHGTRVPILVVQHILKEMSGQFAAQLATHCRVPVREAVDGEQVEPGVVLLAPGDRHLDLQIVDEGRWNVRLDRGPKENSVRPAADVLFRSAARAAGEGVLGIVLTGMGKDGYEGSLAIRRAGGELWAQDLASAVAPSMPAQLVENGLAQVVAPPERLGRELDRLAASGFSRRPARSRAPRQEPSTTGPGPKSLRFRMPEAAPSFSHPATRTRTKEEERPSCPCPPPVCSPESYEYVRQMLHDHAGICLAPNKEYFVATRLALLADSEGLSGVDALVARLKRMPFGTDHEQAIDALTVNETSFFRDAAIFDILVERVLPRLIERRHAARSLQIWSAACATGEEPYSIAMLLRSRFPELAQWRISVLASDISRRALTKAAEGVYTMREVSRGLPADLLQRFFVQDGPHWRAGKELRDMVEFRSINLKKPLPFETAFDVILMRNVLIYFDDETKRSVLGRIAAALRPQGVLILGNADFLRERCNSLVPMNCEPLVAYQRQ